MQTKRTETLKHDKITPGSILDSEEMRDATGEAIHTANLRLVTQYLHKPGHWRLRLSNVCEILEVTAGRASAPRPFEFSLMTKAGGELPSCGTLQRLTKHQSTYVEILVNDLKKVARAKDLAKDHELATNDKTLGVKHVVEMTRKVGQLPVAKCEVEAEERRQREADEAQRAEQAERAKIEVEESIGGLSLEAEMRAAQKKAEKRARQKARKKQEKLQAQQQPDAHTEPSRNVDADVEVS